MSFMTKNTRPYRTITSSILLLVVVCFLASCRPSSLEPTPLSSLERPSHFPPAHYTASSNPYSKEKFLLGRKLFFDPILSVDSSISCASCHQQQFAFSDAGQSFSVGVDQLVGTRNSPPIFNMAWNKSFMWDGGVNHLEVMPLAPIANPVEMNQGLADLIQKLNKHNAYPALFQEAFQQDTINSQLLLWAIAHYQSNLVSADSKYDHYLQGKVFFTEEEKQGLLLFRQYCANCHKEPLLTDQSFHNNGLDHTPVDSGRYNITLDAIDIAKFKTPSLRNITHTAPYMHDGRFQTLEEVLQHYTLSINNSATLAAPLQQFASNGGIPLSSTEKEAIVSFLYTLTDHEFLTNPNYSE